MSLNRKVFYTDNKRTAFGENQTAFLTPVIQFMAPYNILNTQIVETFINNGSITADNALVSLSNQNGIGDYATLMSLRNSKYRPGLGNLSRFTCLFNTGIANSLQLAGIGTGFNGLFFGYNGTDFGIMKRYGGKPEVRRLEITTAFTTSATIIITLNSVAFNVDVVNASSSLPFSAHQVENNTYSGWEIDHIGPYIYFISQTPGSKNGTYSVDFSTSGGAGTFSTITTGVSNTEEWIYQTDWNVDKMDGRGKSQMTLDTTKLNVYQIQYQFLGAGAIKCFVEDDDTGEFKLVHIINYTNNNTVASLGNPSLRMLYAVASLGSTTAMTMKMISFGSFVEGQIVRYQPRFSIDGSKTLSANTELNVITIKNTLIYNGIINHSDVLINSVSLATDGTKSVLFKIYKNGTLGDDTSSDFTNYSVLNSNDSVVLYDNTATNKTISDANLIFQINLAKVESRTVDLTPYDFVILRGQTITITATSSASNDVNASISFLEDH